MSEKPESFIATLMSGIDIECYDAEDYEARLDEIAKLKEIMILCADKLDGPFVEHSAAHTLREAAK